MLHSLSRCHARRVDTSAVVQVVLGAEDCHMVLCSDGIYEFMTNDDIVNLGAQPGRAGRAGYTNCPAPGEILCLVLGVLVHSIAAAGRPSRAATLPGLCSRH